MKPTATPVDTVVICSWQIYFPLWTLITLFKGAEFVCMVNGSLGDLLQHFFRAQSRWLVVIDGDLRSPSWGRSWLRSEGHRWACCGVILLSFKLLRQYICHMAAGPAALHATASPSHPSACQPQHPCLPNSHPLSWPLPKNPTTVCLHSQLSLDFQQHQSGYLLMLWFLLYLRTQ